MLTSVCTSRIPWLMSMLMIYTGSPRDAEWVYFLFRYSISLNEMPVGYAIQNRLTPFVSMQNHHTLVYREEEREMFPTLKVNVISRRS